MIGRGIADKVIEMAIPQTIGESVGTENEAIPGFVNHRTDLGFHELAIGPEGLTEGMTHGVAACFTFVDLAFTLEPTGVGVIMSDLMDTSFSREVIDAAITSVTEIHAFRGQPTEAQCGSHAIALFITAAQFGELFMDGGENFLKKGGGVIGHPEGGNLEILRQPLGYFFDGDAAGEFSRIRPSHAVGHREDEIGFNGRGLASFAEVVHFMAVEAKPEKGIFIVFAHFALMGHTGPAQVGHLGAVCEWAAGH